MSLFLPPAAACDLMMLIKQGHVCDEAKCKLQGSPIIHNYQCNTGSVTTLEAAFTRCKAFISKVTPSLGMFSWLMLVKHGRFATVRRACLWLLFSHD
jgi:hypothetical protein